MKSDGGGGVKNVLPWLGGNGSEGEREDAEPSAGEGVVCGGLGAVLCPVRVLVRLVKAVVTLGK